jgi:hypothetical protein
MSEMSTDLRTLPKPIKGAGLTNPGVVILQFLVILLFETIEYSIGKVGIITGLAIIIAIAGGFYLGRPGTSFTAVVNPPIVFFFCTIVLIATIGGAGVHVAKFGLDLVTTLGGAAPYLVVGTVIGWGYHLWSNRKPKTSKEAAKAEESVTAVESLGFKEELN